MVDDGRVMRDTPYAVSRIATVEKSETMVVWSKRSGGRVEAAIVCELSA